MGKPSFTYATVIAASERVAWRLEEIFPEGTIIKFDQPHLPEALANVEGIACFGASERLALNHIRGHSYMNLFAFVEEYIIAQTVKHAEAEMFGDHDAIRALLRFGEEEIKHQQLFHNYCKAFQRDFGVPCGVLGSAAKVAGVILSNSPIAVMLVTLHLELMTQQHYTDCVKDSRVDPLVRNILMHHWIEEAQHAKIDVLELDKMLDDASPDVVAAAIEQYFGILAAFDGLLAQQTEMDLETFRAATGRQLTGDERREVLAIQLASYRKDFLVMGMSNRMFVDIFGKLTDDASARLRERTASYA